MLFSSTLIVLLVWVLLIIITTMISQTNPEMVVHEVMACCHHEIQLKCTESNLKIGIVQARYLVPGSESKYLESLIESPWVKQQHNVRDENDNESKGNEKVQTLFHPNYVSLWDMDVTFVHELFHTENKLSNLNEPEWMKYFSRIDPFRRFTTPSPIPNGYNFTQDKLLEMPIYDKQFLDKNTIWTQPLFPLKYHNNHSSSHNYGKRSQDSLVTNAVSDVEYFPHCLSYEALLKRGQINNNNNDNNIASGLNNYKWRSTLQKKQESERKRKPTWHYTDLRSVFNRRCSGRTKCTVDLLRNKLRDQDLTRVCNKWPDGRIVVKYICYDSSSSNVHAKCNEDMEVAREGFIINPGYPDIYPGGLVCQWKLQVLQQRILLVFLDVSLRGQEKSVCRDELVINEQGTNILSTCGDHKSAIAVLSFSSSLNVTFTPKSRLGFPKRGFLLYYRAIGCKQPSDLINSYIVSRNASHINLHCDLGHLFPDILATSRWLFCNSLENSWAGGLSHCTDIRSIMATNGTINIWPVLDKDAKASIITDYIAPVTIMVLLFFCNGFLLLWIRRKKQRLEDQLENKENQEMEEIIKTHVLTPEESTYTLSSDGTESAVISSTIKKTWPKEDDDELTLTLPETVESINNTTTKTVNGGAIYNSVPTNTNENGYLFQYGFPRTTAV